jgi:hypothetical protein
MTVKEMERRMGYRELVDWMALHTIENAEREAEERKAARRH